MSGLIELELHPITVNRLYIYCHGLPTAFSAWQKLLCDRFLSYFGRQIGVMNPFYQPALEVLLSSVLR